MMTAAKVEGRKGELILGYRRFSVNPLLVYKNKWREPYQEWKENKKSNKNMSQPAQRWRKTRAGSCSWTSPQPTISLSAGDNRETTFSFLWLFCCLTPGLDWTRLFMSLTAGAGTRCMSLLPTSPILFFINGKKTRVPAKDKFIVDHESTTAHKPKIRDH